MRRRPDEQGSPESPGGSPASAFSAPAEPALAERGLQSQGPPDSAGDSLAPPSRRGSSRVSGLDAARVLATLGVVWVHVSEIQGQRAEWATLGRFGTSFYALAAVFLAARAHFGRPQTRTWDVVQRRARRLLVPFLIWSALYAAFYIGTMRPYGHPWHVITRYWGPLFGTAPHLWFLPFAFVAGALASFAIPKLMRLPGWFLIYGGVAITLAAYVFVYGWGYGMLDKPAITEARMHRLARWTEEAPMIVGSLFGFAAYGKYLPRLSKMGKRRRWRLFWWCLAGFLAAQISYAIFLDDLGSLFWNRVRLFANVAGAFWLVAFVAARDSKWIARLAPLGRATYFAYLSHQMILDAVKGSLTKWPGYGSLGFAVASSLGIFLIAVGIGLGVARVRLLRWLSP